MKAQGLPINFIVIAALAILILVLAAGFVIAGGASLGATMAPETARATCNNFCMNAQRDALDTYELSDISDWKNESKTEQRFCTAEFDVQGVGLGVNCHQLVGSCRVTFGDGTTWAMTCEGINGNGGDP